jgi:hypothetical protein
MPFRAVILVSAKWLKPSGLVNKKAEIGKQIKVWQRKLRYYRDISCRGGEICLVTYRVAEIGSD